MAGAIVIVLVLLLIPVMVLMSGAVVSAILGQFMVRDAEDRYRSSELLELDD